MEKKATKKIGTFELVWYIICGAVALWGLTYIVLGSIANLADLPQHDNKLLLASDKLAKTFGLGFLGWGVIIFAIGMVLAIIVMLVIASKVDRTSEKAARRAARLAKIEAEMADNAEAK